MKWNLKWAGICLIVLCGVSLWLAKAKESKSDPLTGTWECTSHGSSEGDVPFTLQLELDKENVTGSVAWASGKSPITAGTFKNEKLEIHIDTADGKSALTATLANDQLSGEWSSESEKGTWEGKKQGQTSKQ